MRSTPTCRSAIGTALTVLVVVLVGCSLPADRGEETDGTSAERLVAEAVRLMDEHGLFAEGPEWDAAREAALAAPVSGDAEAAEIIRQALLVAGGRHSALLAEGWTEELPPPQMPSYSADGEIGVLTLPGIVTGDEEARNAYADLGAAAMRSDPRCGFILDLTGNQGGDLFPMIAAIAPLLEAGEIGGFIDRRGRDTSIMVTSSEVTLDDDTEGFPLVDVGRAADAPLAVLISNRTGSAGEFVALSLLGRAETMSFGRTTNGLISANRGHPLSDGSTLLLTEAWGTDREGAIHPDGLDADVPTQQPREEAMTWLLGLCGAD